jgi:hypothetical protein
LKCITKYIKITLNISIRYQHQNNSNILCGSFNVDWVANKDTQLSSLFMLLDDVVIWARKKQMKFVLSNT